MSFPPLSPEVGERAGVRGNVVKLVCPIMKSLLNKCKNIPYKCFRSPGFIG